MSRYIYSKLGDKYQCVGEIDNEGKFVTNTDGTNDWGSVYVRCINKTDQLYDYDSRHKELEFYCGSLVRGHKLVKAIYDSLYDDSEQFNVLQNSKTKEGEDIYIFDWDGFFNHINKNRNEVIHSVIDTDAEVTFRFYLKDFEKVEPFLNLKPVSKGASSPFSVKHLPSYKDKLKERREREASYNTFEMPKGYWNVMRDEILPSLSKQWQCKVDETLDKCYKGFSKTIKIDVIKKAGEDNYKVNQWLGKECLWDKFVEYCKSLIENK